MEPIGCAIPGLLKSLTNPSTSQTNVQIEKIQPPKKPDEPERKNKCCEAKVS